MNDVPKSLTDGLHKGVRYGRILYSHCFFFSGGKFRYAFEKLFIAWNCPRLTGIYVVSRVWYASCKHRIKWHRGNRFGVERQKSNLRKKDFFALAAACHLSSAAAEKMIGNLIKKVDVLISIAEHAEIPDDIRQACIALLIERAAVFA